ncbi:MAG TPA: hypothetical protein PKN91_12060, partial [Steroidobacteraceae bacterium]|nr:hypothetical protein [Steroidobacteraceae bacterium]
MGAHKKPSEPHHDPDLDSTAELPSLDDPLSSTDTYAIPTALVADASGGESADPLEAEIGALRSDLATATARRGALELDLRSLSANLRDVEERLIRKGERLVTIEQELEAARAACAEAVELGAREASERERANEELAAARSKAEELGREVESRALAAAALEARGAELAGEADRLRGEMRALRETLAERDIQLAERANSLAARERRLAEIEPLAAQRAQ